MTGIHAPRHWHIDRAQATAAAGGRTAERRTGGRAAQALEQARSRLMVTVAVFALAFGAVGVKLVDATVMSQGGDTGLAQAASAHAIPASRADIVDRNGVLLASSLATASLHADPKLVINPLEATQKLTSVLTDLDYQDTLAKLKSDKRFVWIRRNLSPREHYEVNRLGIPGLYFQREERRVYPNANLTAHVVGFTGVDNNGLMGVEQSFDSRLRSSSEPVQLSLDVRLQHLVKRELQSAVDEFQALGGAGMIMDVKTGEVLAMVSLPDFDPHAPTNDENARFNRNTLGVYEMGSTFKIFNSALALESGKIRMGDSFDATKSVRVGRFTISDYHGKNRWLTVPEVFMYSSNIGSVRMALEVGTPAQRALMDKLGLLRRSPVEIPEVGAPMVPSPWREASTMTIAFGHGLSVSPIQMASATAATVNGGLLHPPTLLKRDPGDPVPAERVISPQTSDQIRRLMRLVVTQGTATGAAAPGYVVGGKTGTAEKTSGRGYAKKALLSSFIGAFPIQDPRYLVMAMVDEPKGNKRTYGYATGGWVAAPLAGRIIQQMGPLMGIAPIDENRPDIRTATEIHLNPRGSTLASY
ncbi:penicillin-binding protein 2 [Skermanella mucosa]|uniref:peptidoglycan D,D-transpeptidase FtsI family protein n=1 Tax=Skermanella mucosa TaxID=1789672 RepID=UPI00192A8DA5|nr:penicillin-binding protein 2 [Skermanella mucosa]UEM19496.1 penicillin-binding protein 2 [Skermanella mucosa]